MGVRSPAAIGFYEGDKELLLKQIKGCFLHELGPGKLPSVGKSRDIFGLVVPHAGYMYSGPVAAHSYYSLASDGKPDVFIIIGPNHTGFGAPIATTKEDWVTPLGKAYTDKKLIKKIVDDETIFEDPLAHVNEHSIEVQIPFLQFIYKDVNFVPICMFDQSLDACKKLCDVIYSATAGMDFVVIASSDFSHYEPYDVAYKKDSLVLKHIEALEGEKFYSDVRKFRVSVCGYGPVTTMLLLAKKIGVKSGKILKYATSGDITKDKVAVVGYCSAKVVK